MKKLVLLCMSALLLFGCAKSKNVETVTTKVCKSTISEKVGTVWTFKLNEDNQVMDAILETHVSPDYLKDMYSITSDEDVTKAYVQTKNQFINEFKIVEKEQTTKKWFKAEILGDDKGLTIDTKYSFRFSDELFSFKLNDFFLNNFKLMKLYNSEIDALEFNSSIIANNFFAKDSKAECN